MILCSERNLKCHSDLFVLLHRYQSLLSVWLLKKASQFTTTWRSPTLVLSCSAPLPLTAASAGHGESNTVSWRTGHEAVPVLEVFTLLKEGIAKASNHPRRGAPSAVAGVLCWSRIAVQQLTALGPHFCCLFWSSSKTCPELRCSPEQWELLVLGVNIRLSLRMVGGNSCFSEECDCAFQENRGLDENSCFSASEVKPVVAGLARSWRLSIFSAAVVVCAEGSWLTSF